MKADQLNAVASLLKTQDKNLVFLTCIKFLMEEGLNATDAIEVVLGASALEHLKAGILAQLAG